MEDDKINGSLEDLVKRIDSVRNAITDFLTNLEMQEKLDWKTMLQNYASLSSEANSLVNLLKSDRSPIFRNLAVVPILLSLDVDPELVRLSEERLHNFTHEIAPECLKTKLEERLRKQDPVHSIPARGNKNQSIESVNKTITQFNNILNKVLEKNGDSSRDRDETEEDSTVTPTFDATQTRLLVEGIMGGHDMKSDALVNSAGGRGDPSKVGGGGMAPSSSMTSGGGGGMPPQMSMGPMGMNNGGGKYNNANKMMKAQMGHPYAR